MSEHTEAVKSNLGDAGAHLKQAASAAGGAVKSAAGAAGDELRMGKAQVKAELADGALSGLNAAEHLGGAAGEQAGALMDKGRDLLDSAAAVARIEAQIDRDLKELAKRPRKKFIGARAQEYRFAQYVEDWRQKVERIGTLNYPEAARGRLYGSLLLSVTIRSDGTVERVGVHRSSGHKVLDDAALRIVKMAAPYSPFPPDIRKDYDVIEITRTWTFTNSDQVRAN